MLHEVGGQVPWSRGYVTRKWRTIERVLASAEVDWLPAGDRVGNRLDERVVEYPWTLTRLAPSAKTILDAGGSLNHAQVLTSKWLQQREITVSTLGPEENIFVSGGISYQFCDLRDLPFRSDSFDAVVCISTIEHVGLDNDFIYALGTQFSEKAINDYVSARDEMWRVVRSGGDLFITVPFGRAVNHGWFQVFDKSGVGSLADVTDLARTEVVILAYRDGGWRVSSMESQADAEYFDVHTSTSPAPDGAAASRAIACLRLTKL
jgi:SAM-dependent methyltransferase